MKSIDLDKLSTLKKDSGNISTKDLENNIEFLESVDNNYQLR